MRVMEIKYFEFYCKFYYFYENFELTRAPRDTDRSPEYNEHFCYKLD